MNKTVTLSEEEITRFFPKFKDILIKVNNR